MNTTASRGAHRDSRTTVLTLNGNDRKFSRIAYELVLALSVMQIPLRREVRFKPGEALRYA